MEATRRKKRRETREKSRAIGANTSTGISGNCQGLIRGLRRNCRTLVGQLPQDRSLGPSDMNTSSSSSSSGFAIICGLIVLTSPPASARARAREEDRAEIGTIGQIGRIPPRDKLLILINHATWATSLRVANREIEETIL